MEYLKFISVIVFTLLIGCQEPTAFSIEKDGNIILITGPVLNGISQIEIQFHSTRNQAISSYHELSTSNPEKDKMAATYQDLGWDIFYPVVDLVLQESMTAEVVFKDPIDSLYSINGMFHEQLFNLNKGKTSILSNFLQYWENNFYVNNGSTKISNFYLSDIKNVKGPISLKYELLSTDWQGDIIILDANNDLEIFRFRLEEEVINPMAGTLSVYPEDDLSRDRLLNSLKATVQFTRSSQDQSPYGKTSGGLNLFHDLEARTYRRPLWVWGWGPSIKTLIESSKIPQITQNIAAEDIMRTAMEIGETSLKFQISDKNAPAYGVIMSRFSENKGSLRVNFGFEEYYSVADAQFLVGWGWIPLYKATGDIRYLEGAQLMTKATDRLTQEFEIIPMDYMIRAAKWKNYALNEQGFATEGINELYKVDPNPEYPRIGHEYMQMLFKKFDTKSGIWNRLYRIEQQKKEPTKFHTRGVGWAMEGLIALYDLTKNPIYLEKAVKMGRHLIEYQLEDGSWSYDFKSQNRSEISEKGTALWSLLFYKLYHFSKDPIHLKTARKSLLWCLNNQYDGQDIHAYGGLVGVSRQSGVIYRPWFPLACTYTSGFFGLAVLEELKLQENEK